MRDERTGVITHEISCEKVPGAGGDDCVGAGGIDVGRVVGKVDHGQITERVVARTVDNHFERNTTGPCQIVVQRLDALVGPAIGGRSHGQQKVVSVRMRVLAQVPRCRR